MRVCDITRSDEVQTAFTIIEHAPGEQVVAKVEGYNDALPGTTIECGKTAGDALRSQAWGTLHTLTPPALRKKDPKKAAAGKRAASTRAANKAQAAPTPPSPGSGASGAHKPTEASTEAPSGYEEP